MYHFHITACPGIVYLKKIRHQWVESSRFSGFKYLRYITYLRSTYSPIFRVRCIIKLEWRLSRVTFTLSSLLSAILSLANSVRCFPPIQDLFLLFLFCFWFWISYPPFVQMLLWFNVVPIFFPFWFTVVQVIRKNIGINIIMTNLVTMRL